MEINCSLIAVQNRPPGVSEHLEALGYMGWIALSVGTASTLLILVLYLSNVIRFIRFTPAHRILLLCWVTSMPLVMSFLSLMTILIPRAGNLCDTVKQVFLPFIMMHFVDLTLNFKGGQNAALDNLIETGTSIDLCVPPCCCFGLCFRHLRFNKVRLRMIKALVYQMPLVQLIIIMTTVLLSEAEVIRRDQGPDGTYIFLNILNIICFCTAMWAFNMISRTFAPHLGDIGYQCKAQLVGMSVPIFKVQNFIIVILTASEVVPCIPPAVSRGVVQKNLDACLTLVESFVLSLLTYIEYYKFCQQA